MSERLKMGEIFIAENWGCVYYYYEGKIFRKTRNDEIIHIYLVDDDFNPKYASTCGNKIGSGILQYSTSSDKAVPEIVKFVDANCHGNNVVEIIRKKLPAENIQAMEN